MLGHVGKRVYISTLGICIYVVIYSMIIIKYVLLRNVIQFAFVMEATFILF